MRVFKTRWFQGWAAKQGLGDRVLMAAAGEIASGLIDGNLGGHVFKKRVALPGRGKRGSVRTLVAFRLEDSAFFMYGFAKNQRANISRKELRALRLLAAELLAYSPGVLGKAIEAGEIIELSDHG